MPASLKSKIPLALLGLWCLALLAVRMFYARSGNYDFMAWNLFLAIVPVVAAAGVRALAARRAPVLLIAVAFIVWLAFLPNAPYLVTDLTHLEYRPPVPLWYDIVLLGSFAATGVFFAYASVADVEAAMRGRFGRFTATFVAYGALALCGFGIYAGRFLRWNSWDIVTSPLLVFAEAFHRFTDPLSYLRTWAVTAVYGSALVLGYLALKSAAWSMAVDSVSRDGRKGAV